MFAILHRSSVRLVLEGAKCMESICTRQGGNQVVSIQLH
jgi:hypothetical protein